MTLRSAPSDKPTWASATASVSQPRSSWLRSRKEPEAPARGRTASTHRVRQPATAHRPRAWAISHVTVGEATILTDYSILP